jgi:hypothetical protein
MSRIGWWFKPLSGGAPPPASLVFIVPAVIVALVIAAVFRKSELTTSPVQGIGTAIIVLGLMIGLLIYIPAIVIDSFRSGRRVEWAPWFGRLPLATKILLPTLALAASVVIGVARLHVFR